MKIQEMKRTFCMMGAACVLGLFGEGVFNVSADRGDPVYRCGEKAVLTVSACDEKGALLKEGVVTVRLDNFGEKANASHTFDLSKGNPFRVEGTLDKPGFLRASLKAKGVAPRNWSVAFEPEKLRPGAPDPADFDAFWQKAVRNLEQSVPLDVQCERVSEKSTPDYTYYRVSFATYGARRVYGWMCEPTDTTKKYPLRVSVPGAGIGATGTGRSKDAVTLTMNVHSYPQPETTPEARKAMLDAQNARYARPQGVARYCHAGLHKSREDYFYYATILGINRAVNWVVARPSVDTSQVTYSGTSQGGGFGFYLCGLNKHFTKAAIFVPALTDLLGGETDGRQSGWPRIIAAQLPENREAARRHAPYFDGANFARRIAIPVRVVVGFSDTVCAPCAVYAGYNVIPAKDKAILHGVGMGHAVFPAFYKTLRAWLESK